MTDKKFSRRSLPAYLVYLLNGIVGAAVAIPAALYLLVSNSSASDGQWTPAGDLASLPLNTPTELTYERVRQDGWNIVREKATAWVTKASDSEVAAFHPQCTHLGCAYHWEGDKNQFICPCHASAFDPQGRVVGGPAPRALDSFQTKIQNGQLLLGPVVPGEDA